MPLGLVDQSRVRSPAKPPLQRHQNYPVAPSAAVNITKLFEVQTVPAHRRGSPAKLSYRAIKMLSAGIRLSAGFAGAQLKKGLPEGQAQSGSGHRPGVGAAVERNEPGGHQSL